MNRLIKIAVQSALFSVIWVNTSSAVVDPSASHSSTFGDLPEYSFYSGSVVNVNEGIATIRGRGHSADAGDSAVNRYLARRLIISANNVDYVIDLSAPPKR